MDSESAGGKPWPETAFTGPLTSTETVRLIRDGGMEVDDEVFSDVS